MEELFCNDQPSYYLPTIGITNSKTQIYNEYLHNSYKQIFKIYEENDLDYYVFAGSAIGYVRNKKNLPWADDYDIIIFEEEKEKFENIIIPVLIKNGFYCGTPHTMRPDLYPSHAGWQITGRHINDKVFFLCDVFLTKVDDNGFIRNTGNFGVYTHKNIPINYVKPKKYLIFDGLYLPFFNNVEEYVKLEYGDVIDKTIIYVSHSSQGRITIQKHWIDVYKEFNKIKEQAIKNTNDRIFRNMNYNGKEKLIVRKSNYNNEFEILEYINKNNIGRLYIEDENFLRYCFTIKYYYPNIIINYYMYSEINIKNIFNLNYVNNVYCANQILLEKLNDKDIMYLNKPNLKLIRVITFGTYDLFHYGHDNLFRRCKNYGTELIVGISSDEFNIIKGKKSVNKFEKRLEDVKNNQYVDSTFIEESFEKKNHYILEQDADLLIMGDDWENKFDWVSCMTKYLPRTLNISTSLLKSKIT